MEGCPLQEVGVSWVLYGGTQAPGVATCVRARARAACVPRLGTLSPCTVAHNTHKRKVRDIHTVAAQALCLWLRDAPETDFWE